MIVPLFVACVKGVRLGISVGLAAAEGRTGVVKEQPTYENKGREEYQRYAAHVDCYVYGVVVVGTVLGYGTASPG